MAGSIHQIFLWLIGDDYRKVPFDEQLRRSSKMAAILILDLVSVDFLTTAWVDWSVLSKITSAKIWFVD
jgi:hypothetical protein